MGDHLAVLDQTKLPFRETTVPLSRTAHYTKAIRTMQVRGAPLIGIVAAYGVASEAMLAQHKTAGDFRNSVERCIQALGKTRPTAANLAWALGRQSSILATNWAIPASCAKKLLAEAKAIHRAQYAADLAMAKHALMLFPAGCEVLTVCNSGPVATGGIGTALGSIIYAYKHKRVLHVYVPETRPRMQGKITAWELERAGIPFTVIADGAVGALLAGRRIGAAVVGADRIAANGDTANKLGTYPMAVLCLKHGTKFIVVAPVSTLDAACPDGAHITIEERAAAELSVISGRQVMPARWQVWNPAFDITPRALVSFFVSENGALRGGRRS